MGSRSDIRGWKELMIVVEENKVTFLGLFVFGFRTVTSATNIIVPRTGINEGRIVARSAESLR